MFITLNFLIRQKLVSIQSKIAWLENKLSKYNDYDNYLRRKHREDYLRVAGGILRSIQSTETFKYFLVWNVKRHLALHKERAVKIHVFLSNYTVDYVSQRSREYSKFFSDRGLDPSQIEAIVKDDYANLVMAPAGSGKTKTLTSRIAYLVQRGVDPKKILALAYTNKARDEMEDRLKGEFKVGEVKVTTLHKLGYGLVRKFSQSLKDDVADEEIEKTIIGKAFDKFLESDRNYALDVLQFVAEWDVREERNSGEANSRIDQRYVTLDRVVVDSIAEREIANFLFLNQVSYEHIPLAEWADRSRDYNRYHPDFFLPDYDIYLEHWGIDRDGTVAPWLRDDRERNLDASTRYKMGMEWKREQYLKYGKKLIETNYYEFKEGSLLEHLRKRLEDSGVKFNELEKSRIIGRIHEPHETLDPFYEKVARFINTAKSNRFEISDIQSRLDSNNWSSLQASLAKIAIPVWKEYQANLGDLGMVDFNDMINDALSLMIPRKSELAQQYSHILIDEFQDISNNQLELMKCFLDPDGEKTSLFCVGDDWQNIFSFAGADIQNILSFETHFPYPETSFLKTNYRCPKNIVEASNVCISNNKFQLRKEVAPSSASECQISLCERGRSSGSYDEWEEYTAMQVLSRLLQTKSESETILVLSRYNAQLWHLESHCPNARKAKLTFSTIHKSKGTEADYVLLLGCKTGSNAFPSERIDPSLYDIVKLARSSRDGKANFEEERRLFYVALTRCRKEMYLFTSKNKKSTFVTEISKFLTPVAAEELGKTPIVATYAEST